MQRAGEVVVVDQPIGFVRPQYGRDHVAAKELAPRRAIHRAPLGPLLGDFGQPDGQLGGAQRVDRDGVQHRVETVGDGHRHAPLRVGAA